MLHADADADADAGVFPMPMPMPMPMPDVDVDVDAPCSMLHADADAGVFPMPMPMPMPMPDVDAPCSMLHADTDADADADARYRCRCPLRTPHHDTSPLSPSLPLPLAFPLLLPLALAAEGPIPYAEVDHRPLTLDRWLPATPGPHPGVLLIHGGGWKYGDLYHGVSEQAEAAAAAGLVVVSPNYRLSTEAPWPAQRDDVACALRWMKVHAADLSLDPARIAVVGHSAGGQLALTLAEAPEQGPPAWCPSQADGAVQAAVSLAGPSDFAIFYADTIWWGRKMARELLGLRRAQATPEALALASPLSQVDAVGPPVLQVVGGADALVPDAVAASYDAALRRVGRESEVVTIPGAGHNDVNRADLWLDWVRARLL